MSLKKAVIQGSLWTGIGFVASLVQRFVNSFFLTRLLDPTAFGLMTLVSTAMAGLQMFSDVGISPSIIQNERGTDPEFQKTAMTLQVVRGFGLWIGACAIALPFAWFYTQPMLAHLLPIAAVSMILAGLSSLSISLYQREMKLKQLAVMEIVTQFITLVATIVVAWVYRSVWALVVGGIFGAALKTAMSYLWLKGYRFRAGWHGEYARQIIHFGRWIFLATSLTYFVNWGDRFISGFFLSIGDVGIYNIAVMIGKMPVLFLAQLVNRMLFPAYVKLGATADDSYRQKVRRLRYGILAALVPVLCILAVGGDVLVNVVYDKRYHAAGWMLRMLAIGGIPQVIYMTMAPVALARGNSFYHLLMLVVQSSLMLACMLIGGHYFAMRGVIGGAAFNSFLVYPIIYCMLRKFGVTNLKGDLATLALAAAFVGVGCYLRPI